MGVHDDLAADRGIFARYARNEDYHELLKERLIGLQERINAELAPVSGRAYVDTGPILERELARRAGLGWYGRNTMLIQPGRGSYYFLGTILFLLLIAGLVFLAFAIRREMKEMVAA